VYQHEGTQGMGHLDGRGEGGPRFEPAYSCLPGILCIYFSFSAVYITLLTTLDVEGAVSPLAESDGDVIARKRVQDAQTTKIVGLVGLDV
jgi:hypothetical protein